MWTYLGSDADGESPLILYDFSRGKAGAHMRTFLHLWNGWLHADAASNYDEADGTLLLFPDVVIEGWEATLTEPVEMVIALYADHGTHEQFHSEFKTDLDLERLPSGKFDSIQAYWC